MSHDGKAGGRNKYWLNVKNVNTNAIKSIDLKSFVSCLQHI